MKSSNKDVLKTIKSLFHQIDIKAYKKAETIKKKKKSPVKTKPPKILIN